MAEKKEQKTLKESNPERRKNLYLRYWIEATERKKSNGRKSFVRDRKMKKQEKE
jgi:hypothetical protein